MITSFIPGRVRIRSPRFKDPDYCATAVALLKNHPCVNQVKANPSTGGLLIEYDPEKLDLGTARQALGAIDPEGENWIDDYCEALAGPAALAEISEDGQPAGPRRRYNQDALEYLLMTGAFVICTSSAFLRSKGLHLYSGLTLAGMTAQHIYKYRRRIFSGLCQ